ncbi:MAG: acetate--CoA ligase family protein [Desulfobacteraceae bacterium]
MLNDNMRKILESSRDRGWVLEPDAKRMLAEAGLDVPRFLQTCDAEEAVRFGEEVGFPVVAKIVSPKVLHKSDVGGVVTGVGDAEALGRAMERLAALEGYEGILVEETVQGVELIAGAKVDEQFGPVILLGIGGTAVEIYQDTVIRMAPLTQHDVESMVSGLTARRLLEGYRGADPVDMAALSETLIAFSRLVMDLGERIESVDLNPLMCSSRGCRVADARILLAP